MAKCVFCTAMSQAQAERMVSELRVAGFEGDDISVLFPDTRGTRDFAHEQNTKAPEGAAVGAGTGGVIGGALGLLAGVGALAIPGLGPFIAAGPIMAALGGDRLRGCRRRHHRRTHRHGASPRSKQRATKARSVAAIS